MFFFGISDSLKNLTPQLLNFWPEAKDELHIDAWREINYVNGNKIEVVPSAKDKMEKTKLFFINLGCYIPNEFVELM